MPKVTVFRGKAKSCKKLRSEANFAARESRDATAKNSGDSSIDHEFFFNQPTRLRLT